MKRSTVLAIGFLVGIFSACSNTKGIVETPEEDTHVIIYHQEGRFAGWPANNGVWTFEGDEILVGFTEAGYRLSGGHNAKGPYQSWLGRSLDGGLTWETWDPENYVGDFGDRPELKTLTKPMNFSHEGFVMRIVGTAYHGCEDPRAHFFYSEDKGALWNGPFGFGDLANHPELKKYGLDELTPRTDYIVNGRNECLIFMTAREEGSFGSDRLFSILTEDGGQTFTFLGWVEKPFSEDELEEAGKVQLYDDPDRNPYATECRAVMSSSVMLEDGTIMTSVRRKYIVRGGSDKNWLDLYVSRDGGKTWEFASYIADTGPSNGNPPALALTEDGRLCAAYGNRKKGTIEVRYSADQGASWSDPHIIMDGFWSEDMEFNDLGYPRLVKRSDGRMTAMFYYSTKEHLHHLRAVVFQPEKRQ